MKILHISKTDFAGGADRAALRIVEAQRKLGLDSILLVSDTNSYKSYVVEAHKTAYEKIKKVAAPMLDSAITKFLFKTNFETSTSLFGSISAKKINDSDADIVNLHWTNGGLLSIFAISRIRKPIVWTLHDMWAFSGSKHYDNDSGHWKNGYEKETKFWAKTKFDPTRMLWRLKQILWKNNISIITPSRWLEASVKQSKLMKNWVSETIPNPINKSAWEAFNKKESRRILNLNLDGPVFLFGAWGSLEESRKGFDFLLAAIELIRSHFNFQTQFVVFGANAPESLKEIHRDIVFLGKLSDQISLRLAYSAADVFIIPSRQDNLPNTALEAQACGLPVVAFEIGGLKDLVNDEVSGYLADPFNVQDLAKGAIWAYEANLNSEISQSAMQFLLDKFSESEIAEKYSAFYERIAKGN